MTTLRTAAQQALEALELGYDSAKAEADQYHAAMAGYRPQRHAEMDADVQKIAAAITALKAALAEPCQCGDRAAAKCPGEWEPGCDLGNNPKYAKRVEMTPKELAASIKRGEKWKVAEPVQEPVAWRYKKEGGGWFVSDNEPQYVEQWNDIEEIQPLYTAPPQRKPLTEEEIDSIWDSEKAFADIYAIARAIERAHGIGGQP